MQLGLEDDDGSAIALAEAEAYDLRGYMPGVAFTVEGDVPMNGVDDGRYRLAVRIIQPDADKAKPSPWKLDARDAFYVPKLDRDGDSTRSSGRRRWPEDDRNTAATDDSTTTPPTT